MAEGWYERIQEVLSTPKAYVGVGVAAVVGVVTATYYSTRPTSPNLDVDYDKQSVKLEGGVYASRWSAETGKLLEYRYEDVKTVYEGFLRGRRIKGDEPCLGARTGPNRAFEWISYNQVYDRVQAFGSGLFRMGVKPGQDTKFGIFAQNRPEWVLADLSCQMFSMVTVALYDTLGSEAVIYVINLCEIGTVVCDTAARAQLIIDNKNKMPSMKNIIMIEELTDKLRQAAEKAGLNIKAFSEVELLGKANLQEPKPPKPSDTTTICFTSGTTGNPKGVILTHGNLVADVAAVVTRNSLVLQLDIDDVHLSYLPLAHMYERLNMVSLMTEGARTGFYSRDIMLLFDDLQTLKPTLFPTVPRLLNKIRDKVISGVQGSKIKSFLLNLAYESKLAEVKRGIMRRNSIWDKIVFSKIQALLGGRVRYISTGSAPLSKEVFDFTRCVFGCLVFEGYGQTECTAGVTTTIPGDPASGLVGPPLDCNYIKLIDVPEMEYFAKDGRGEVCVKGTNVTPGYYRNPEKTMELFTADGWLRTGDVGMFHPNGSLQIIDRCKHIFKLAQGEYIAPERIEAIYTRSKYIQQCFVDGDSLKSRCVAVVVPDPDVVLPWATNNSLPKDIKQLCQNETLKKLILQDMLKIGESAQLNGYEQVLDIALEPEPFSLEAGLLTPTFKNKRPQLRKHLADRVAAIYARNAGKA
nr:hypothetical protein BaRGS_003291 [Batillaria attramentaria]